jgi:hypothetical protein
MILNRGGGIEVYQATSSTAPREKGLGLCRAVKISADRDGIGVSVAADAALGWNQGECA